MLERSGELGPPRRTHRPEPRTAQLPTTGPTAASSLGPNLPRGSSQRVRTGREQWGPGQVAELAQSTSWQALQPPPGLRGPRRGACPQLPDPGGFGHFPPLGAGYPETKRIIFDSQVYRNAVYFVGDVGSINYAAGTACLPRLSPCISAVPGRPTPHCPRRHRSHGDAGLARPYNRGPTPAGPRPR